ncbi:MAG: protein kinase [Deltaproteobacteria bacterium]|nr:protein kinase [Deltaproteobacteria bacterium]
MAQTGKYRLGPRLGGGGMAEVFRGTLLGAEGFSRPVAIKHMLADLSTEPDFEEMFRNEARIAAALHHPNIVGVMDFDRDEKDRLFLVMELVEGKDLRHLMKVQRPPVEISAYIIAKLLEALDYAHALELDGRPLHLVHRDVTRTTSC